jgi:hypothetical protein
MLGWSHAGQEPDAGQAMLGWHDEILQMQAYQATFISLE